MAEVNETELPGVGVRYDFETREGERMGVLVHRTGRRELLVYGADDPDACVLSLRLEESEARTLSELLGASQIVEHLADLHQEIEGLTLDWMPVEAGSRWAGRSLADAGVHTETGVSIVAIIRGTTTIPAPHSTEVLQPGDTAVGVGTAEGLARAQVALRHDTRQ